MLQRPQSRALAQPAPLELGVVIPTFKEAPNVRPLLARLEAALEGVAWQAIFVDDDSPDGTAAEAKAVAAVDPRVICLRRIGRRGRAQAQREEPLQIGSALEIDRDQRSPPTIGWRRSFPVQRRLHTAPSSPALEHAALRRTKLGCERRRQIAAKRPFSGAAR